MKSIVPTSDPLVKLGDAIREIELYFDKTSVPKRATIIAMIDDGSLRGKQLGKGKNYYVFRSSLKMLVQNLSNEKAVA